jgi:hypothetical protein
MRSNLGWPPAPAPHWATISCVSLFIYASTAASDRLYIVCDGSKGKSTGSDQLLNYILFYNFVCQLRRSNLGRPPSPHWATISCVALSISASTVAIDRLYVIGDNNKGKSTGSFHLLNYKLHYNFVCELMRSNLGWPPSSDWAKLSSSSLFISASTGPFDDLLFGWDSSKS